MLTAVITGFISFILASGGAVVFDMRTGQKVGEQEALATRRMLGVLYISIMWPIWWVCLILIAHLIMK